MQMRRKRALVRALEKLFLLGLVVLVVGCVVLLVGGLFNEELWSFCACKPIPAPAHIAIALAVGYLFFGLGGKKLAEFADSMTDYDWPSLDAR